MKFVYLSIFLMAAMVGCKSQYATIDPSSIRNNQTTVVQEPQPQPTVQPEEVVEEVEEEIVAQPEVVEENVVVKQEEVVIAHGSNMMRYCVIIGSFINESNALTLRKQMIEKGYAGCTILKNNQGMFRVSVESSENEQIARKELSTIRLTYPQFKDAWLLKTK